MSISGFTFGSFDVILAIDVLFKAPGSDSVRLEFELQKLSIEFNRPNELKFIVEIVINNSSSRGFGGWGFWVLYLFPS